MTRMARVDKRMSRDEFQVRMDHAIAGCTGCHECDPDHFPIVVPSARPAVDFESIEWEPAETGAST